MDEATREHVRRPLAGVAAVDVSVDMVCLNRGDDGVGPEDVRSTVELMLRVAGVRVVDQEAAQEEGHPTLAVEVVPIGVREGYYALSVRLELRDDVVVKRNGAPRVAATWAWGDGAGCAKHELPDHLRQRLSRLVTRFCNDALAANPRGRSLA